MRVRTLFQQQGEFSFGEVEIKLLPGIPILQVVGQPDAHIRECGVKLKSALRSCGFLWPKGHQIVVNLRPSYFRKSSAGIDLAIALGFLALTKQISKDILPALIKSVVYGEVGLDGRVFAPPDLARALAFAPHLITGEADESVRDGTWSSLATLNQPELKVNRRAFDWQNYWQAPPLMALDLHSRALSELWLAAHMRLNVLVAGPQGSGKSTWAKAAYSLSPAPCAEQMAELQDMFGNSVLENAWRPFEQPHHSITPLAMIGGGVPIVPGVISRAHGGVLVMDEFLEFNAQVLEALREPMQNGSVEHARCGERARFSANFQLLATTNLCPCGKLDLSPDRPHACSRSLTHCRSVCARLSGPIMDRFDMVVFSHSWLRKGKRHTMEEAKKIVERLTAFAKARGPITQRVPTWVDDLEVSHRRRNALMRVARGLADFESSCEVKSHHYHEAFLRVEAPMNAIRQLFA